MPDPRPEDRPAESPTLNEGSPRIQRHCVLLVHGTFAYNESDTGDQWWQRESSFAKALAEKLGSQFLIAPATQQDSDCPVPDALFRWSGANSEDSRRKSARLLLEHFRRFESRNLAYHVIAHSHGGGVLWEALCQAARAEGLPSGADNRSRPLPNLKSWMTVGTPFLHFVPSKVGLWALIPLVGFAVVAYCQYAWFTYYWQTADETFGRNWLVNWPAFLVVYVTLLFSPALIALMAYRWHKMRSSQEGLDPYPDRRRVELKRFRESLGLLCLAAVVFGGFWLIPWFRPLAVDVWVAAIIRIWHALPVVYSLLALSIVIASLLAIGWNVWRLFECRERVRLCRRAWQSFHERYHCLSCSRRDEAITGLRKTQHGVEGPLLPRLLVPGAVDYSQGGRSLKPELTESWRSLPFLPWRLVRDWCLRPVYNEVVAALIDEYVLGRMTAYAHGSDLSALELGFVSTTPIPLAGEAPGEPKDSGYLRDGWVRRFSVAPLAFEPEIIAQVRAVLRGPPVEACSQLESETGKRAAELLSQVRDVIAVPSLVAVSLRDTLNQALAHSSLWSELLIHTTYFKSEYVQDRLAEIVRLAASDQRPSAVTSEKQDAAVATGVGKALTWPPSGFVARLSRGAVRLAIWSIPWLVLWLVGMLVLYPYSPEYQVREIVKNAPIVDVASLPNTNRPGGNPRTEAAQWCVDLIEAGRSEAAFETADKVGNYQARGMLLAVIARKLAQHSDDRCQREAVRALAKALDATSAYLTAARNNGVSLPALPPSRTPPDFSLLLQSLSEAAAAVAASGVSPGDRTAWRVAHAVYSDFSSPGTYAFPQEADALAIALVRTGQLEDAQSLVSSLGSEQDEFQALCSIIPSLQKATEGVGTEWAIKKATLLWGKLRGRADRRYVLLPALIQSGHLELAISLVREEHALAMVPVVAWAASIPGLACMSQGTASVFLLGTQLSETSLAVSWSRMSKVAEMTKNLRSDHPRDDNAILPLLDLVADSILGGYMSRNGGAEEVNPLIAIALAYAGRHATRYDERLGRVQELFGRAGGGSQGFAKTLVPDLLKGGFWQQAWEMANLIEDGETRLQLLSQAYDELPGELAGSEFVASDLCRAISMIVGSDDNVRNQSWAYYERLLRALALVKKIERVMRSAGRGENGAQVAKWGSCILDRIMEGEPRDLRVKALLIVADARAAFGEWENALRLVRDGEQLTYGLIDETQRSRCWSAVGAAFARLGLYRAARLASERAVARDRLRAYTVILQVLSKRNNPNPLGTKETAWLSSPE